MNIDETCATASGFISTPNGRVHIQDVNPTRRLDWRAQRATMLASRRHTGLKQSDDRFVRAYHRMLPVYLRVGPDVKRLQKAFDDSLQLLRACEAQLLNVEDPTLGADIVKAQLLAGLSNEEIAKASSLHPDA